MRRRWRALVPVFGVLAVVAGLFGFAPSASAQLSPTQSRVTLVHAIVGVPVDVYVDGALVSDADGFAPTEFLALPPLEAGDYEAVVYAHVAAPPADEADRADLPVIAQILTVPAGVNVSVVAQSLFTGEDPELVLTPFVNDFSIVPEGSGRLTVRHVANADAVDVYANGVRIVEALPSGEKSDLLVPTDTYTITVYETGAEPGVDPPVAGPVDVDIDAETLQAVYVGGDVDGSIPLTVFTRNPAIPSTVTLLHLVPGGPAVDVYAGSGASDPRLVIGGLQPLTTYALPGGLQGTFNVQVYAAQGSPPPLASGRVDAPIVTGPNVDFGQNDRLSVAVGFNAAGGISLNVFANDVSSAGIGSARLSVRHVAEFGPVDVYAGGTAPANLIVTGLANGAQAVLDVDALGVLPVGSVTVVPTGADPANPATPRITNAVPLAINAGTFTAVYAVGTPDDGSLQLFVRTLPLQRLVNPVTPTRIADTRDGTGVEQGRLQPGEILRVSANGVGGVPNTGAVAVAVNVTAAEPSANGYLNVFPCDDSEPGTSNVNYTAGEIAEPNAVIAELSAEGDFCITTFAETDVIVDVNAWFAAGAGYIPVTPDRILDTRDGTGTEERPLLPGQVLVVPVSDDPDITGAVLNVTAANTTAAGFLTVFPCDGDPGNSSNVNYEAGVAGSPNAVLTDLDDEGDACITTYAEVDVIVDLQGVFTADASFIGFAPDRVYDTRDGTGGAPIGTLDPGETAVVQVVPTEAVTLGGVNAVALNVTATEAEANGYLTVFPCNGGAPYASSVNYTTEELSSPNAVVIGVSPTGTVCITSYAPVDVVVDLTGVFAA